MDGKQITPDGRLWYIAGKAATQVGFTKQLLEEMQSECWSVIPTHAPVKKGQPLFAIETNDTLLSVLSPFAGRVSTVNFDAQNSPEKLTDSDIVFEVVPPEVQTQAAGDVDRLVRVPREPGRRRPERPVFADRDFAQEVVQGPRWDQVRAQLAGAIDDVVQQGRPDDDDAW